MQQFVLRIKDLDVKRGQSRLLRIPKLELDSGSVYGLLGKNGAGKTTLLKSIAGLTPEGRKSCTVQFAGHQPRRCTKYVGYAAQEPALYPALNAEENLKFWSKMATQGPGLGKAALSELVGMRAVEQLPSTAAANLSGGQVRRVHVACTLALNRPIVLLDEPTAGVDDSTRRNILDSVVAASKAGCCVIYSTHYQPEIDYLNPRLIQLANGMISESKTQYRIGVDGVGDLP